MGGGLDLSYNNNQGKGQFPKLEMLGSNNLVRIFFISRKGAVKEQIRFFFYLFLVSFTLFREREKLAYNSTYINS